MRQVVKSLTMAELSSNSEALEVGGSMITAVGADSDFSGALLNVQASYDGGSTFTTVEDPDSSDVAITIAAGELVRLPPEDWGFAETIRFVSDQAQTSGTPAVITAVVLDPGD